MPINPERRAVFKDESCASMRFRHPTTAVVLQPTGGSLQTASIAARVRLLSLPHEPLFIGNWTGVLMIHYEVEPEELQRLVPFTLDLWQGRAFASLVSFRLEGMRPRWAGRKWAWLFKPQDFLNVRTYVVHQGEPGIFFLAEWLSSRVSVLLGPPLFGLPYRPGDLFYDHGWVARKGGGPGRLHGRVKPAKGAGKLAYSAVLEESTPSQCQAASREEWLMERYTAFTERSGRRRFFRVWHEPWRQMRAGVEILDESLLRENWPLFERAALVGANFAPGLQDVWMGWPHPLGEAGCPSQMS